MKRGLKGSLTTAKIGGLVPDARITPMKRGLKDCLYTSPIFSFGGCKDYPDEKGTERIGELSGKRSAEMKMQGLPR